jgi:hypothetical protein
MIADVALADVLGEKGRKQQVAALRTGREPDVSGLRSEGAQLVVREHGEASSACSSFSPPDFPANSQTLCGATMAGE